MHDGVGPTLDKAHATRGHARAGFKSRDCHVLDGRALLPLRLKAAVGNPVKLAHQSGQWPPLRLRQARIKPMQQLLWLIQLLGMGRGGRCLLRAEMGGAWLVCLGWLGEGEIKLAT